MGVSTQAQAANPITKSRFIEVSSSEVALSRSNEASSEGMQGSIFKLSRGSAPIFSCALLDYAARLLPVYIPAADADGLRNALVRINASLTKISNGASIYTGLTGGFGQLYGGRYSQRKI